MKAIVLEKQGDWAAVLCEDGVVTKARTAAEVGETIELEAQVVKFEPKHGRWRQKAAAAAIAVCVLAGSFAYVTVPASATVAVSVGSSEIEIGVNRLGRVVSVEGTNEDSREIAESLKQDMKGKKFDRALERAVRRFDESEMLDDDDEYMIIDVRGGNEKHKNELTNQIREMREGDRHHIFLDGEEINIEKSDRPDRPEISDAQERPEMPERADAQERPEMPDAQGMPQGNGPRPPQKPGQ